MFEIGTTLREARLRRGYDIPRCESGTKIRGKYLRAMEDEQFDVLPAPTYVRGFLRSYAEFLGLDWQLVLDEYESRFGGFDDPAVDGDGPSHASRRRRQAPPLEKRSPEARLLWFAIGGVLTVAILVWMGVGGSVQERKDLPPPPPTTTSAAPVELRLEGVGAGTTFGVRSVNARGKVLGVGRLQPGAVKEYPFRDIIWVKVQDPTGVKVTVAGKERLLIRSDPYIITPTGQRPAGSPDGGG